MTAQLLVGIDPGVTTGLAVWRLDTRALDLVTSMQITEAMDHLLAMRADLAGVIYEDARLRKWLGSKGREALQGAGSIKRDCSIWAEFLGRHGIPYRQVAPQAGGTKWTAAYFSKVTKWDGRTNEHGRDAALLVYGRSSV